jgi:photosystem II stability/assembly factor-like uncharacterized protein
MITICRLMGCLALLAAAPVFAQNAPTIPVPLVPVPAAASPAATQAAMLASARAGKRIVAVGDHGIVLLSDDRGRTFRQARSVPVSSILTGVSFADARRGWAVGHWGAILFTEDGGETWSVQRLAVDEDRPLFSVHFIDAQHGLAIGLWSLMLRTADGGRSWSTVTLPPPPDGGKADRNLFRIFADARGTLFVAGERGAVLISLDGGLNWSYALTGYKGSFWTGASLADGSLLVAGLRGTIYRSRDGGRSWQAEGSGTRSSLTDIAVGSDGAVLVGLDGVRVDAPASGYAVSQRDDRMALTTVVAADDGQLVAFSRAGVVADFDRTTRR